MLKPTAEPGAKVPRDFLIIRNLAETIEAIHLLPATSKSKFVVSDWSRNTQGPSFTAVQWMMGWENQPLMSPYPVCRADTSILSTFRSKVVILKLES